MEDKVIEKIQKLFALANNNPSEEEAITAAGGKSKKNKTGLGATRITTLPPEIKNEEEKKNETIQNGNSEE